MRADALTGTLALLKSDEDLRDIIKATMVTTLRHVAEECCNEWEAKKWLAEADKIEKSNDG
jgi:hypothetical protein